MSAAKIYAAKIARTGADATEHSFRTPLQNLLETLAAEIQGLTVLHEPPRQKDVGAPDFLVINKSGAPVGCVECKKPGENLEKLIGGEQLKKYETLAPTILLTDYWNFILLRGGESVLKIKLQKKPGAKQLGELEELIRRFLESEAQTIGTAKELAAALAARCAPLREALEEQLPDDKSALRGLFTSFQETIYADITDAQFADALAQTLVYGLLMAKLKAPDGKILDLYNAEKYIPQNFALIREIVKFLKHLEESGGDENKKIKYLLENIAAAVNAMDARAVAESMAYKKDGGEDPYLNFYEDFLAAYDPALRESRGVYYTPPQAARFIVRAAHDILRRNFNLHEGLGDSTVTALDFAAGTGTFMLEMFRKVLDGVKNGGAHAWTHGHLLKNFYGFEYLIAPYVIAHLKLSYFLESKNITLGKDGRVHVYLTNTLQKTAAVRLEFLPALTEETNRAQEIKEQRILVITGNPPYSGHGQTAGKEQFRRAHKTKKDRMVMDTRDTWIGGLLKDYFQIDGKPLKEKNPKWLQDDYVKFIRFAQWKMEQVEKGVVAIITNHAFLDNPTFRGMRKSLLNTFNRLYFLDLHGNSKKQERAPDGGKDENIFDIQQGVSISIFVKKPRMSKGVFHADFWGTREGKYKQLAEDKIKDIKWKKIKPAPPFYLFIPHNGRLGKKYEEFYSVKDIFPVNSVGIITARDDFTMDFDKSKLQKKLKKFTNMDVRDAREHFNLGKDSDDWKISLAQKDLLESKLDKKNFCQIAYRPFDMRETYYTGNSGGFHCRPRPEVMNYMFPENNIGLITVRQARSSDTWRHCCVIDKIMEACYISNKGGEVNYLFPLYYNGTEMENGKRHENINSKFRKWLDKKYGKKYPPEKILGYIYAKLHSPKYQKEYAEFLRLDFPRVPFPKKKEEFERLAKIGGALIKAHLLQNKSGKTKLRGGANPKVETVRYHQKDKRLYFNKEAYFSPVSEEVFNFYIGGYRPLDKFLKSRKNRQLTLAESETIEKAAAAIEFTIKKMKEIDG